MFLVFKINSINIIILIWCEELSNIERVTLTNNKYNIIIIRVICLLSWVYNNLYTIYWDIYYFLFYIFINMILIYQYYFIFFYNFDFLIKLNIN